MATKKKKNETTEVKKSASYGKQKRKSGGKVKHADENSIIDNKAKTDILAVALIFIGVALFAVSLVPTNAPVTAAIVNALRFIVGVGVYIFPFALIILGGSFFFRMERQKISVRVAIGLSLIFVAILTIISLCTPTIASGRPEGLFDYETIIGYGGIIGSAFAWIGVTLFGNVVSLILMIALIVAGMIVIGLSITKIVSRINERREDIDREHEEKKRLKAAAKAEEAAVAMSDEAKEQAAVETVLMNNDDKKTKAIAANTGKKPGLKTRILGFKNKDGEKPEFDYEPNKTRQIGGAEPVPKVEKKAAKPEEEAKKTEVINKKPASAPKPMAGFVLPSFDILKKSSGSGVQQSEDSLKAKAEKLKVTLEEFGIKANVVGWVPGPTVTLFKVDLPAGVRVSRITALNDDIALALAAPGVRVFAPIPGTTYVGIEIPNDDRETVLLSDVLKDAKKGPLQMAIGKDVEGNSIVANLASMPHLLIGGTTGSGKSVSINAMITSILMRATPSEVRLILIDPKRVEFTPYNGIPHLYVPVVTEPKEAASALSWGVAEMEARLKTFSEQKVRNIDAYNAKVQKMSDSKMEELGLEELPYIVIVIDELADLMMAVGKEVEFSISRIAQLARAAGIHLIVATQRPSTNVVTGLIKANITSRIAFNVASGIDSRVILDTGGAESLIGLGDLLFSKPEFSKPLRVQGCFVTEDEIFAIVKHLKEQGEPEYHDDILKTSLIAVGEGGNGNYASGTAGDDDSLFWEAAEMIVNAQHGSTSSLQRRFKIGYARAGRIMDMLEEKGIVGPQNGSKPREVMVDASELEQIKALETGSSEPKKTAVIEEEPTVEEKPKEEAKEEPKKDEKKEDKDDKEELDLIEEDIEEADTKTEDKKGFDSKELIEEDIE